MQIEIPARLRIAIVSGLKAMAVSVLPIAITMFERDDVDFRYLGLVAVAGLLKFLWKYFELDSEVK
jgi:hypothetical protein